MIAFLALLPGVLAGCEKNEYFVSSAETGQQCLPCNLACVGCSGPGANECESCSEMFSEIQGICVKDCPMGFISSNNKCLDETTTKIPFDLDFSMITNEVQNQGESSAAFKVFSGNSSSFYPDYDQFDPHVVQGRGLFFDGSAYLKGQDTSLTFGPVFTISAWFRATSASGCLFSKRSSSREFLSISFLNSRVDFKVFLLTLENFTSSNSFKVASWTHLYLKLFLTSSKSRLLLKIDGSSETSPIFSTFFNDVHQEFFYSFGCRFLENEAAEFYSGFLFSFKIANQEIDESVFVQTKDCHGCSRCPVVYDQIGKKIGNCLSHCESFQYVGDGICFNCSDSCRDVGCVRNDSYCNLCLDDKCRRCKSPQGDCFECKENAKILNGKCQCFENFYWKPSLEKCESCGNNCELCDGQGTLGCSRCKSDFFMLSGICFARCPTGFEAKEGKCEKNDGSKLFDLKFDKIQGVVKDGKITVQAGRSSQFYPNYEKNDPIASYKRGYYFTGSSFMRFVQLDGDISAVPLNLPPEFYIGWWLSSTNSNGVLLSSSDSSYKEKFKLYLNDSHVAVMIFLNPFTAAQGQSLRHSCENSVTLHSWTYIGIQIKLDPDGNTLVVCYLNGKPASPELLTQGFLSDLDVNNNVLIGSQQTGPETYESFFVGFIFEVTLHVQITQGLPGFSSNCSSPCSACPESKECLSTCHISHYPTSDNNCIECNVECLQTGCRTSENKCNVCYDPTCKTCIGYGPEDCVVYDCDEGFYKTQGMNECKACHPDCFTCSAYGPASCTSCSEKFLLNSACHGFCPGGYEEVNKTCEFKDSTLIHFTFNRLSGNLKDETSGQVAVFGKNEEFFPQPDNFDPIPFYGRGLFFTGSSYLQLPPNRLDTSSSILLGNQFVVSFWLKSKKDGVLFSKQEPSSSEVLSIRVKANKIELKANLQSSVAKSSESLLQDSWNFIAVGLKFQNSGNSNFYLAVNFEYEVIPLGVGQFQDVLTGFTIFVGSRLSSSGPEEFWSGFLYTLTIYSSLTIPNEFTSQCRGSCQICPSSTNTCLDDCDVNTWSDGSQCSKCQNCQYETCRRPDLRCNLCEDLRCAVCSDYKIGSCSKCVENAKLVEGECFCSEGFTWDPSTEKCELCQQLICQSVCLDFCPTGFEKKGKKCSGEPKKVLDLSLDNVIQGLLTDTASGIQMISAFSPEFYPHLEKNDPVPTRSRGFYFDGKGCFLQAPNSEKGLVLSPMFSAALWVRPEGSGVVFARQKMGTSSFRIELNELGEVFIICQLSQGDLASSARYSVAVDFKKWLFLGAGVTQDEYSTTLSIISVNNQIESHVLGTSAFIDFSDRSVTTIGARFNASRVLSNHFKGFVLSVSVWNYLITLPGQLSTACRGSCTFCPLSGACPGTCDFGQYFNGSCQNCSETCSTGCSRLEDCNLCSDRLCDVCANFSANGCLRCVDGAQVTSEGCACVDGETKTRPDGRLYCQTGCMSQCLSCYSKKNGDCLVCRLGLVLESGLCLSQCPTGAALEEKTCGQALDARVVYFVFNSTSNVIADQVSGFKAYLGTSDHLIPVPDINDPVPSYLRGLFFAGTANFLKLANNPSDSREIVLGNSHSITLWLRPFSGSQKSCILTKENEKHLIFLYLDIHLKPFIEYKVFSIFDLNPSFIVVTGSALEHNSWNLISVVFQRSGTASMVTLHSNGLVAGMNQAMSSYFDEPSNLSFKLGYSEVNSCSFKGFIYELSIFNFAVIPSDPSSYACWCEKCTESGDCLSSCNPHQYLSTLECKDCPDGCTVGCGSQNSCSLHPDHLCEVFTSFESSRCEKCANLSIKTTSGCQCVNFTDMIGDQCFCQKGFEEVDGFCFECLKHVQAEDFFVYFNEDYSFLVFEFKVPVVPATSSICSRLFEPATLKSLGTNPSCKWETQGSQLLVKIGRNAEVDNWTFVSFQRNSLITNISLCGSFRGPVGNKVIRKFDPPPVVPRAIITGPNVFYKLCGNLTLSGRSSMGGYGRGLKYNWEVFVGSEKIGQSSESFMFFGNFSELFDRFQVSLRVSNWLGQSNSTTLEVVIKEEPGLNLEYDFSVSTRFTAEQSKSIYVFPSDGCLVSRFLDCSWNFTDHEGDHSFIDYDLIKRHQQQCKVFIPRQALGPGFYTVEVRATDADSNITGSTFIFLKVEYSELRIQFSPHYFTFNKQTDLVLSGSVKDLDKTSEKIDYLWTCDNSTDCSSIISDPTAQSPVIGKDLLLNHIEYNFSLFVIKGKRKAEDVLTVLIDSNSSTHVYFPVLPQFVKSQENFAIKTLFDKPCNCTFAWTVLSSGSFEVESDVSSKDLVFRDNSLDPGQFYIVQLNITQESGDFSVFKDHFLVNFLPMGGGFMVEPLVGTARQTIFQFCAFGWFDVRNENFGLTYQFGFYYQNEEIFFNVRNESHCFWTQIAKSGDLDVFVRVYDVYGSFTEKGLKVQVNWNESDIDLGFSQSLQFFERNWLDLDSVPAEVLKLAVISNHSGSDLADVIDLGHQMIELLIENTNDWDGGITDVVLSLIYQFSFLKSNHSDTLDLLKKVISRINNDQVQMSVNRAEYFPKILKNSNPLTQNSLKYETVKLSKINKMLKSLAQSCLSSLGQSQSFLFGSSEISLILKLHQGSSIMKDFSSSVLTLPESNLLMFESIESILSVLISYNIEKPENNSLEASSGVEFCLFKASSSGEVKELRLNLREDFISIKIPVWNARPDPKCVYWTGKRWSSGGCRLLNHSEGISTCGCSHTSLYSSGSFLIRRSRTSNSQPLMVVISCLVSIFWVLLNCFFIIKDQKEAESKIFVDEIISKIKQIEDKGKVLETELAEPAKDPVPENSSQKRDSQFVPTAGIGVVGAYFHDNQNEESPKPQETNPEDLGKENQLKLSDSSHYQGQNTSNLKTGFLGMKSMYEEMKEPEKSSNRSEFPDPKMVLSGIHETENILSSDEMEKIKSAKNPPKFDFYYDKASDLSLKEKPKLGALLGPDEEDLKYLKRGSQFIPRVADIQDFQSSSDRIQERKPPKFAKVLITPPQDESSKELKLSSSSEKRDSKLLQVHIDDAGRSSGSSEGSDLEKPADIEKVVENTELFTQPNSPRAVSSSFYDPRPRRRYSSWIVHYYTSGFCFFHENYSRSSRSSQAVTSFLIQVLLIGIIVKSMGEDYISEKGSSLKSISENLEFQDVAFSCLMSVLANYVTLLCLWCCFRNKLPSVDCTEQDRIRILNQINRREITRFVIIACLVVFMMVAIGVIELGLTKNDSIFWFLCTLIAVLVDVSVLQIVKVLIYKLFGARFVLPSY